MARNQDNMSELEDMSIYSLNIEMGIYCFSSKRKTLRRKNKDLLARNGDNVSKWGNISIHRLLFQFASTTKIQLTLLVKYKDHLIIFSLKINLF